MDSINSSLKNFYKALRVFRKNPEAALVHDNGIIRDLIMGWNNHKWSAGDEYLWSCIYHSLFYTKLPILECGSGLSTIVLGIIAEHTQNTIWSLENSEVWQAKVQKVLQELNIKSVHLCVNPMRNYGGYYWYDPPLRLMPSEFGLVICDGPPGDTIGGRSGLIPIMREKLKKGTLILLDDADREGEQMTTEEWKSIWKVKLEKTGIRKPFFKIQL